MKAHKQNVKHSEKRQNTENIEKLKREIKAKGGDEPNEKEFNRLFNGGQVQRTQGKKGQKQRVFDQIQKSQKAGRKEGGSQGNEGGNGNGEKRQGKNRHSKAIMKKQGGKGGKRPGKAHRSNHKQRNKKMR